MGFSYFAIRSSYCTLRIAVIFIFILCHVLIANIVYECINLSFQARPLCFCQHHAPLCPSLHIQLDARLRLCHYICTDKRQREQFVQLLTALGCCRCATSTAKSHLLAVNGKRSLTISCHERT